MVTLITILHLSFCFFLIVFVLLQDPKGGGAGGMFGGGGGGANTLLGATGATTFLTRFTRWCAICFGVSCLILTVLTKPDVGSVIDSTAPISEPAPVGTLPGAAPAAPEGQAPPPAAEPPAEAPTETKK